MIVGEEGFFLMRYTGEELIEPLHGDFTNAEYAFHKKRILYVDKRDAVYLMGPDYDIIN